MINILKNWRNNIYHFDTITNDDTDVDIARANYQKYQDSVKQEQKNYIKLLCREINGASRNGRLHVVTKTLSDDFMTYEFLMEIKEYFEQKGFIVKEESSTINQLTCWLTISWEL